MEREKPLRFHQSKSGFPTGVAMRLTTSSPRFKFKCQRCGVLKTQDGYSNKEINGYKDKLAMKPGMKPHPVDSLLKCRACNDGQLNELECQGPCGKVLPLARFSKQQRKGGLGWCMECITWKESFIEGVPIPTAPGSGVQPGAFDSDVEPENTTGTILPPPNIDARTATMTVQSKPSGSGYIAPHMRGLAGGQGSSPAVASDSENRSVSSASNIFEGARTADMRSESGWSTRDTRRRRAGPTISYNAYDLQGVHHLLHRAPSSRSSEADTFATPAMQSGTGTGIAPPRAPPRAAAPTIPSASPASPASPATPVSVVRPIEGSKTASTPTRRTPVIRTNQTTGWAKAVGSRTAPPAPPQEQAISRPEPLIVVGQRQRGRYDSSDDEI
ncbi:Stc1 domain-domain-containing protein [Rutstroemia sp. NJR-2017a BVV2]|nr:Stc1 domain-domain-containing protein [Rutstroemia sp. NJR-2017a BVV2]